MIPGRYIVLVEMPGKDTRALPGSFESHDDAVDEHVSFRDNPGVSRFLVAEVISTVSLDEAPANSSARCLPT